MFVKNCLLCISDKNLFFRRQLKFQSSHCCFFELSQLSSRTTLLQFIAINSSTPCTRPTDKKLIADSQRHEQKFSSLHNTLHDLTPDQPSLSASYIHTIWSYTWPTLALCKPHTHCLVLHLANPRSLQATHTLPGLTPGQLLSSIIFVFVRKLHLTLSFME